jgi:cytochrome c-type biogenesis protein CcmH/NrfG
MRTGKVSGLILAAAFLAGTASAQVPRGFTPQGADQQRLESNTSLSSKLYRDGVDAIKARNFQVAEGIFEEVLRQNPTHPEGNLMMGTTKMSLGKWEDAKKYLEIAVRKDQKNPDPKSRLAVTLIKLGDMDGAMKQRADLEKMSKDCKGKCRNADWIAAGLAMVDGAMPPKQP